MRKTKGFTLVELLVVIAIIALLMGILMPALARVRQIAYRMVCGTNLAGLGKAILLYSNDYNGEFPRVGGRGIVRWADTGELAYWNADDTTQYGRPPEATITSNWYVLVKRYDMTTKQFVCKGDVGTRAFILADVKKLEEDEELEDFWDFGDVGDTTLMPGQYCSYSYHMPFDKEDRTTGFPINSTSDPACPLAADRTPYLDKNAKVFLEGNAASGDEEEDPPECIINEDNPNGYYSDPDRTGNSACHQREGQNVLYQDMHVSFERYPNIGIQNDNIWKCWPTAVPPATPCDWMLGEVPYSTTLDQNGNGAPESEKDAYLVLEGNDKAYN